MTVKLYAFTCGTVTGRVRTSDGGGRGRYHRLFRIGFQPGEEISARLQAIHRDPGKIDLIINSHFHFDHVGGNALIPNATLLVQRREWEAGMDPEMAARRGFKPA